MADVNYYSLPFSSNIYEWGGTTTALLLVKLETIFDQTHEIVGTAKYILSGEAGPNSLPRMAFKFDDKQLAPILSVLLNHTII